MDEVDRDDIDLRFASGEAVNEAMTEGAFAALRKHREAGDSVVIWREGRVVTVSADGIAVGEQGGSPSTPEMLDPAPALPSAPPPAAASTPR